MILSKPLEGPRFRGPAEAMSIQFRESRGEQIFSPSERDKGLIAPPGVQTVWL